MEAHTAELNNKVEEIERKLALVADGAQEAVGQLKESQTRPLSWGRLVMSLLAKEPVADRISLYRRISLMSTLGKRFLRAMVGVQRHHLREHGRPRYLNAWGYQLGRSLGSVASMRDAPPTEAFEVFCAGRTGGVGTAQMSLDALEAWLGVYFDNWLRAGLSPLFSNEADSVQVRQNHVFWADNLYVLVSSWLQAK